MGKITDSKKMGVGSISLILSILGAMFSFTAWEGKYFGEHLLSIINISFPSGIISLIILFISLFIGYKYKNDCFAKSGRVIALAFIFLIVILSIINYFIG